MSGKLLTTRAARRFAAAGVFVLLASFAHRAEGQFHPPPPIDQNFEVPVTGLPQETCPGSFAPPPGVAPEPPSDQGEPPLAGGATYPTADQTVYPNFVNEYGPGTPTSTGQASGGTAYSLTLTDDAGGGNVFAETIDETALTVDVSVTTSYSGSLTQELLSSESTDGSNGAVLDETLNNGVVTGFVYLDEGNGSPNITSPSMTLAAPLAGPAAHAQSQPVPEPSTVALLGAFRSGLVGFLRGGLEKSPSSTIRSGLESRL